MTRPTLMKYLDLVTKGVEKLISKAITDTFDTLIGCASHRFNLEMQTVCEPYEPLLQKMQNLMKK